MLKKVLQFLLLPFLHFLYFLAGLLPRDSRIWVFGAWFGQRYGDNAKWLFLHCSKEHQKDIKCIWISKNRQVLTQLSKLDLPAYHPYSLRGLYYTLRAKVYVFDNQASDINGWTSRNAMKVNLWHGVPLKKILMDDKTSSLYKLHLGKWGEKVRLRLFMPWMAAGYDMVAATSEYVQGLLAQAFNEPSQKVAITGYPRNDILLWENPKPILVVEKLKENLNARRVICYVPTHRKEGHVSTISLFQTFDREEMEKCLARNDAIFLIKMHYYHTEELASFSSDGPSRIHWLSGDEITELNSLLPFVDVMITDYSSAYIDYLLLDRPIIFAPFDLEEYLSQDRALYEDYNLATPGPKCCDWHAVIAAIDEVWTEVDRYREARKEARRKYHSYVDAGSSERVFRLLQSKLL